MGLPGKRRSSSKGRRSRAHLALVKKNLITCPKCKKPILPHRTCPFCGSYQGREVFQVKSPKSKVSAKGGSASGGKSEK